MATEYGAFDLSGLANKPTSPTSKVGEQDSNLIPAPFIRFATDNEFDDVVQTSMNVPVILDLFVEQVPECQQLTQTLEELATEYQGLFQLVKVDVSKNPGVKQAFQAQSVPMVVAFLGGRPAPLFQGIQPKAQVKTILDQVLQLAAQSGLQGRLSGDGSASHNEIPQMTPEEIEINELAQAGKFEEALEKAQKALRNDPANAKQYQLLADQLSLQIRLDKSEAELSTPQPTESSVSNADPLTLADNFFARGQEKQAFEILLDLIKNSSGSERDPYRERLLELMRLGSNPDLVKETRMALSRLLF